jgi:2-dehydropantoate 2-reductase
VTRYLVLGAGAVGGTIGGRLHAAGRDVLLVARGDHLDAMRQHGLRLRTPSMDVTLDVEAVAGPEEVRLGVDDVLILAAKTQQLPSMLTAWVDAEVFDGERLVGTAGATLPIFTATNGVAAEDAALRYFARVFGVCVWLPAARLDPGVVVARGEPVSGVLHLGRVPGPPSEDDRRLLDRVAEDWSASGFSVRRPDDVMAWKYRKLLSNIGNVFQALVGSAADVDSLVESARTEARAVFDAAGVRYTDDAEESATRATGFEVRPVPGVDTELGGSTWQSLTRGTGDIETDYLNGEIAAIAHRHQTTAPVNATLARLGRRAAAERRRPGDLTVEELAAELGLAG